MKKFTIMAILVSVIMIGFTTCKRDTSITCNLGKTDNALSNMTILFKAAKTGDGTLSTLTYKVGSTEKTISSPALPWSVNADASAGDAISITATGTTSDGSLTISYDGKNTTAEIHGSDYCSHSNN